MAGWAYTVVKTRFQPTSNSWKPDRKERGKTFVVKPYQREHAIAYANRWWNSRNPLFPDFSDSGGDCTNFVSQCIFAGSCQMNDTPTFGWYYRDMGDRSPSWTGVEYLWQFLTTNPEVGPFGHEVASTQMQLGDVVQLGNRDGVFYHSLLLTGYSSDGLLLTAHTNDARNRPLSSYSYAHARFLHVDGVRFTAPSTEECYERILTGGGSMPPTSPEKDGNGE